MTLETLRGLFAAYTGRADLQNNDADVWFLNQGSRMLDRLGDWPHNRGRHIETLVAGEYHFALPRQVRVVKHIHISVPKESTITGSSSSGTKWLLEGPRPIVEIEQMYPDLSDTDIRSGPIYWGDGWRPLVMPDAGAEDLDLPADLADVAGDSAVADHLSVVIAPPPDKAYFLTMHVYKYTPDLVADSDTNFWSTNYAEQLLLGAKCVYQRSLDNYPTADKIRAQVYEDLTAYYKDKVEGELNDLPDGVYTAEVL